MSIAQARKYMPLDKFRELLRRHMLKHPQITLQQVAKELGVTRQRAGAIVGKLERTERRAPRRDQARGMLAELEKRVAAGESAEKVASDLGISLPTARKIGFRSKQVLPPHGKGRVGCDCLLCRKNAGKVLSRSKKADDTNIAMVLDWLAWCDPDSGEGLTQGVVGRLSGVRQQVVSRVSRAEGL
jgi:hypothetical protein